MSAIMGAERNAQVASEPRTGKDNSVPAPSPNGNGRKGSNRRYRVGLLIIALGTIAFYITLFRGLELDYFIEYAKFLIIVGLFIQGVLTVTDSIMKWRGNGGAKP